jgi:membrane fusion protein (multidrug efflux system)
MNANVAVCGRDIAASASRGVRKVNLKHLAAYVAIGLGALGAVAYGHHWLTVGRFLQSTDDAYVGGDITVIAPKVAGFIDKVAVSDNQQVAAGQLLVKLDDRDYRAALARAEAAADAQRATLENLEATRRLQLAVIAQAHAGVTAANAEVTRAHDDAVRFRDLAAHSAASIQVFQKADADYKEALAQSEKTHATVDAAQRQLDVIDTQKRQTQAALAEAMASVDLARLNLSYTELRAPIAGVVGNRSARTGAYAPIGAQLISIVPAQGLWVDANFKESQLAQMHAGQPATVTADVLPGHEFVGHIGSLAPATGAEFSVLPGENATGNFTKIVQRVPVRIVLDAGASTLGRLRPGLSVTVNVDEKPPGERPVAERTATNARPMNGTQGSR